MEEFDIYKDISERTNGDIYVGVVGPVRAGKSTFITKFMEKLVVPNIKSKPIRERMRDELPQSANGKVIMTTQPKFVPNEAVSINLRDKVAVNVRLVDCVGYMVDGATGHMEDDKPRMVKTPWSDEEMPFEEAADFGTRKVIATHSTIGIVMTTDGSITTELPRSAYVSAEERVIGELKELGKPFVIIMNSTVPASKETLKLCESLAEKYGTPVMPLDVINLSADDIKQIFEKVLYEFPLCDIEVETNGWVQALPIENTMVTCLKNLIYDKSLQMNKMSDFMMLGDVLEDNEYFDSIALQSAKLGEGKIVYKVTAKDGIFYKALSEECKIDIADDFALMSAVKDMASAKKSYDKLKDALDDVEKNGYGVVCPSLDEMTLEEPQIVKQGSRYGVKLKASAPSLHIMKVDIESEVSPVVGSEQQSEEMLKYLLSEFENDPLGIWETNMFGKSLHMLVKEGLNSKLMGMPLDTQKKMRKTLSRIINEGKGGVICILL